MQYNILLALLVAARTLPEGVNAAFTEMPRPFARISAVTYLRPLQIEQYEDRECRLLKGGGFYLHLTEDPIYVTN